MLDNTRRKIAGEDARKARFHVLVQLLALITLGQDLNERTPHCLR